MAVRNLEKHIEKSREEENCQLISTWNVRNRFNRPALEVFYEELMGSGEKKWI